MSDELKMSLKSMNITEEKMAQLKQLFPEAFTENKVDFERLKQVLGEHIETGQERYGITWAGKSNCFKIIQDSSVGTLKPCREESVNFDTSENLFIEGDNLEVLKLLQKSYYDKVKMIYIDPPYNTGNEFIYPDCFSESLDTYLKYTGQKDAEGKKFSTNVETDGRFHSKWMNMMYTRLYLARNLLKEDGVLFVSIDDHELDNLKKLLNEIFGEENAVGIISWKNVTDNNPTLINKDNEFILCFAKSLAKQPKSWKSQYSEAKDLLQREYERLRAQGLSNENIQDEIRVFIDDNTESMGFLTRYKFVDNEGVYTGSESVHNPRAGGYNFEVLHPITRKPMRKPANGYRFPEATFRQMEQQGIILYGEDEKRIVKIKKFLKEYEDTLRSVIVMDGRLGSYDLKRLFGSEGAIFTNPKPADLLKTLISYVIGSKDEEIILDFFGGSSTTAQATIELNKQDDGKRRFILVQLPEKCPEDSLALKEGYRNISDIGKERIRRVINKIKIENPDMKNDLGFKVLKLCQSNFKTWETGHTEDIISSLKIFADHIDHNSTHEDILYEILLKSGFELTTKVEKIKIEGKDVFSIEDGAMFIYLADGITKELTYAIAEKAPSRFVCLDHSFHYNDQLKTNTVQLMKSRNIDFRTV